MGGIVEGEYIIVSWVSGLFGSADKKDKVDIQVDVGVIARMLIFLDALH